MSVESYVLFALVLLYSTLWLDKKVLATCSTNQKLNQNQSWLARARFPALDAKLLVFAWISDWFILFFVPVVIGWSNNFGFSFRTLIWQPLLMVKTYFNKYR